MRGMEGTCWAVLPSLHIGSTGNEMTGPNVICRPHSRKKNQRVMNCQPSTSISGKHHPENARGEGKSGATAPAEAFDRMTPAPIPSPHRSATASFLAGFRAAWVSALAYVVIGTYIGITALAHDFGFDLGWVVASTALVWA